MLSGTVVAGVLDIGKLDDVLILYFIILFASGIKIKIVNVLVFVECTRYSRYAKKLVNFYFLIFSWFIKEE